MKDIRRTNLHILLRESGGRQNKLAAQVETSASQINQWLSGFRAIREDSARRIETNVGKPERWMDEPRSPVKIGPLDRNPSPTGVPSNAGPVAHKVSLQTAKVAPTITWEQLMRLDILPAEFHVVLPDDAMAPKAGAGTKVKFRLAEQAEAGDGVLVVDAQGGVYFRERHAGLHGQWEARATHPAHPSLHSQTHGLRVLAVFTGIDTPWSALMR
jgi:DNA-binding transcriptional regulator YdaS (Cro superfamily)